MPAASDTGHGVHRPPRARHSLCRSSPTTRAFRSSVLQRAVGTGVQHRRLDVTATAYRPRIVQPRRRGVDGRGGRTPRSR